MGGVGLWPRRPDSRGRGRGGGGRAGIRGGPPRRVGGRVRRRNPHGLRRVRPGAFFSRAAAAPVQQVRGARVSGAPVRVLRVRCGKGEAGCIGGGRGVCGGRGAALARLFGGGGGGGGVVVVVFRPVVVVVGGVVVDGGAPRVWRHRPSHEPRVSLPQTFGEENVVAGDFRGASAGGFRQRGGRGVGGAKHRWGLAGLRGGA